MGVKDVIEREFSENHFTGEIKKYTTTESIIATPYWGEWECIREFVQNALDEMTPEVTRDYERIKEPILGEDFGIESDAEGTYVWDRGRGVKIIDILITGLSRKRFEMKPTRGEFGEGIKKAISTLMSKGIRPIIYTKNGYKVTPYISRISIEGESVSVISYMVEKYDVKMDYGTIVYIPSRKIYSAKDFTSLAYGKPACKDDVTVRILTHRCYDIVMEYGHERMKNSLRGNEVGLAYSTDIENLCKEHDVRKWSIDAAASTQIFDIPNGFISYRDIILGPITSMESYNIWSFAPTDALGRDRKVLSMNWVLSELGAMYRYLIVWNNRDIIPIIRKLVMAIISGVYNGIPSDKLIEYHMYLGGYYSASEDTRKFLRDAIIDMVPKNTVFAPSGKITDSEMELLKYNRFYIVIVPHNLSLICAAAPYEDALKKVANEIRKSEIVPDSSLSKRELSILNMLRSIVDYMWKYHMEDICVIREIFAQKMGKPFEEPVKPTIHAYSYTATTEIERGIETVGHCDMDEGEIGISRKLLRSISYDLMATFTHELAHHISGVPDSKPSLLKDAIEKTAGLVEYCLIEMRNRKYI